MKYYAFILLNFVLVLLLSSSISGCNKNCPDPLVIRDTVVIRDTLKLTQKQSNEPDASPLVIELQYAENEAHSWENYLFSLRDVENGLYGSFEIASQKGSNITLHFGALKEEEKPITPEKNVGAFWRDGYFIADFTIDDASGTELGRVRFRVRTKEAQHSAEITDIVEIEGFKSFLFEKSNPLRAKFTLSLAPDK